MDQFVKDYFVVLVWQALLLVCIAGVLIFATRVHPHLGLLAGVGAGFGWVDASDEVSAWVRKRKEQLREDLGDH